MLLAVGLLAACQTTDTQPPVADADAAGAKVRTKVQASMIDAARASEQRDDTGSAIAYYRSAYERDPKALEAALGLSRNLRRANRPREAMIIAERSLEVHKREPRLMSELGKAQLASSEALMAIETLSRAGALLPGDWEIPSAIGVGYDRLGRYQDAERWYLRALKLEPSNPVVLNNYALSLAQRGELQEAIAALERAIAMPESGPRIRQNLALLHATNGDFEAARRLVRRDLSGEEAEVNLRYYRRIAERGAGKPAGLRLPPSSALPAGSDEPRLAAVPRQKVSEEPLAPSTGPLTDSAEPEAPAPSASTAVRLDPASVRSSGDTPPAATARPAATTVPSATSEPRSLLASPAPGAMPKSTDDDDTVAAADTVEKTERSASDGTASALSEARPDAAPRARETPDEAAVHVSPQPLDAEATTAEAKPPMGETTDRAVAPSVQGAADIPPILPATASTVDETARPKPGTTDAERGEDRLAAVVHPTTTDMDGVDEPPLPELPKTSSLEEPATARTTSVTEEIGSRDPDAPAFRIQLGSYRSEAAAKSGISILRSAHDDILADLGLDVLSVTIPESGQYYRVMTALLSRDAAAEVCRQLRSREVNCLIHRHR
ncbi:MAG: tetratricopeptide repeat protein [Alphaproteobacteria bacterium]|nr:tetratricopeptide repeat protein [Alphaproteobacteria bacterium]